LGPGSPRTRSPDRRSRLRQFGHRSAAAQLPRRRTSTPTDPAPHLCPIPATVSIHAPPCFRFARRRSPRAPLLLVHGHRRSSAAHAMRRRGENPCSAQWPPRDPSSGSRSLRSRTCTFWPSFPAPVGLHAALRRALAVPFRHRCRTRHRKPPRAQLMPRVDHG
jgi:hypothetical protein